MIMPLVKVSADDSTGMSLCSYLTKLSYMSISGELHYKDFAMIRVGDNYVTSKLATEGYGDGA